MNGQDSWNFFRNDFSTHIPPVGLLLTPLALKFATATKNIRQVRKEQEQKQELEQKQQQEQM